MSVRKCAIGRRKKLLNWRWQVEAVQQSSGMRLSNVNTNDIRSAVAMACGTMSSVFNADDFHRPFFGSELRPDVRLNWHPVHSEAHVPGRHLNALLSAERVMGIKVDPQAISNHAAAAAFSYSAGLPLPINRARIDGPLVTFNAHNLREGFHALYALGYFRQDCHALEIASRSVRYIQEHWSPDRGWNEESLKTAGLQRQAYEDNFISGIARCIGPLVKLYRDCGSREALALAVVLKDKAMQHFPSDGSYVMELQGGHTHSTTCVMSGLALLAEVTQDEALMKRVHAFYVNGLWKIRDAVGWVVENARNKGFQADCGEVNNTGDVLETALILAQHGYPECYDDVELIVRCHLLPSQLRDVSWVKEPENPQGIDGLRDVARRHLGAFGFPAPYGLLWPQSNWVSFNMDIVGGATASLVEAWKHIVHTDDSGVRVNLLFDYASDRVEVRSPCTHDGVLSVTPKRAGRVTIRVPHWADGGRPWRVQAGDIKPELRDERWLVFDSVPANFTLRIEMPLPRRRLVLHHLAHDIRVDLRGDEVLAMDNPGTDLTFFAPI